MLPRSKLVLAFAVAMLLLSGALLATTIAIRQHAPDVSAETGARAGAAIGGPFTLVATDGKSVTDQTYRGKWMLIYFGYTFCPDACPTALNNLSVALKALGADAAKVQPLFITVDPKRDTRAVMAEYLKAFDSRIVGLTGSQAQTDAAAKAYHVYVEAQKGEGDNYLVDHSAYFYVMDGQGKFVDVIAGNVSGEDIAAKLRTLMERRA
jgi:protein SCO1/2